MSLRDVEHASEGVWKAAVVGAYERGDRNVTVPRLYDLAAFYGVPLSEILPDSGPPPTGTSEEQRRVVLDLQKLQEVPDTQGDPLLRFAHTIQSLRGDFNGKVLTVREDDLMALALAYQTTLDDLSHRFKDWGLSPTETLRARRHVVSVASPHPRRSSSAAGCGGSSDDTPPHVRGVKPKPWRRRLLGLRHDVSSLGEQIDGLQE